MRTWNFPLVATGKRQTVFCLGLVGVLLASCGKKSDSDEQPAAVVQPTPAPQAIPAPAGGNGAPNPNSDSTRAPVTDALAVSVLEVPSTGAQNASGGKEMQFGLINTQTQVPGIVFKCKLESAQARGVSIAQTCTSPHQIQPQSAGQYYFTVYAVHEATGTIGNPTEMSLTFGGGVDSGTSNGGQGSNGGGVGGIGGGAGGVVAPQQVGDMFLVNIPQGFHMVYRSSTFDNPGFLTFQYINGGYARDIAAPYAYSCANGENFQSVEQIMNPSGVLDYCRMTPQISYNDPANPWTNSFRWINMSMMSYNSIAMASDNSLVGANGQQAAVPASAQPSMAKLYANVFTDVAGAPVGPFKTELSNTVSRMNVSCVGQVPQYMGEAPIFQGYFSWQIASVPLFGCTVMRNAAWYVEVGAFPMDQNMPILPSAGWGAWIGQSFLNVRAAEIVVELGPYPYGVLPIAVSPEAQALMVQNLKKALPSMPGLGAGLGSGIGTGVIPGGNYPGGQVPGYNNQNPGYNQGGQRPGYNNQNPGYNQGGQRPGYNNQNPGYNQGGQRPGYNNQNPGYNQGGQRPGYNPQRPSYNQPGMNPTNISGPWVPTLNH